MHRGTNVEIADQSFTLIANLIRVTDQLAARAAAQTRSAIAFARNGEPEPRKERNPTPDRAPNADLFVEQTIQFVNRRVAEFGNFQWI